MKTKLVYVLASTDGDFFYEQCLVSILSAKYYTITAHAVLVTDNKTYQSLVGKRLEIKEYFDEVIVIDYPSEYDNFLRSRLMKVNLRSIVKGDFLYIDVDTLIVDDLSEIDNSQKSVYAVLDGHVKLNNHPVYDLFYKQCSHVDFDLSCITKYFSGGVIYSKDDELGHAFYQTWANNYMESVKNGILMDEPSLNKSNYELRNQISEMSGIWNCQMRFGAAYISCAKILHFCCKKNMPTSKVASREFLYNVKFQGINTIGLHDYISNWKNESLLAMTICTGIDYEFVFSKEYEKARKKFIQKNLYKQIYHTSHLSIFNRYCSQTSKIVLSPLSTMRGLRNWIIGRISSTKLCNILYEEKIGKPINWKSPKDFNEKIIWMLYKTDTTHWSILADKLRMREFVTQKGYAVNLPILYETWEDVDSMNFTNLPQKFVMKCNHDNGSTIIIFDRFSVNENTVKKHFIKCLNRKFGFETAEPHYTDIKPKIMIEEYIENDKDFSDTIVNYKFFSFNGNTPYCQVVYNVKEYKRHISVIYKTEPWTICPKKTISKYNTEHAIPQPIHLNEMLDIVKEIGRDLPFCRIDMYETKYKVYIGEFTFMPGCARNTSFSQDFLNELGSLIKLQT